MAHTSKNIYVHLDASSRVIRKSGGPGRTWKTVPTDLSPICSRNPRSADMHIQTNDSLASQGRDYRKSLIITSHYSYQYILSNKRNNSIHTIQNPTNKTTQIPGINKRINKILKSFWNDCRCKINLPQTQRYRSGSGSSVNQSWKSIKCQKISSNRHHKMEWKCHTIGGQAFLAPLSRG